MYLKKRLTSASWSQLKFKPLKMAFRSSPIIYCCSQNIILTSSTEILPWFVGVFSGGIFFSWLWLHALQIMKFLLILSKLENFEFSQNILHFPLCLTCLISWYSQIGLTGEKTPLPFLENVYFCRKSNLFSNSPSLSMTECWKTDLGYAKPRFICLACRCCFSSKLLALSVYLIRARCLMLQMDLAATAI